MKIILDFEKKEILIDNIENKGLYYAIVKMLECVDHNIEVYNIGKLQ